MVDVLDSGTLVVDSVAFCVSGILATVDERGVIGTQIIRIGGRGTKDRVRGDRERTNLRKIAAERPGIPERGRLSALRNLDDITISGYTVNGERESGRCQRTFALLRDGGTSGSGGCDGRPLVGWARPYDNPHDCRDYCHNCNRGNDQRHPSSTSLIRLLIVRHRLLICHVPANPTQRAVMMAAGSLSRLHVM